MATRYAIPLTLPGKKMEYEEMMEDEELDVTDWKTKYQDLYQKYQALGHEYQSLNENMKRIKPVYEKMYASWFYWWIKPNDPEFTGRTLMRCTTCHRLFWGNGEEEKSGAHKGHLFSAAKEASAWEFFRMKAGLIR